MQLTFYETQYLPGIGTYLPFIFVSVTRLQGFPLIIYLHKPL